MPRALTAIVALLVAVMGLTGAAVGSGRAAAAARRHNPRAGAPARLRTITFYSPALGGRTHINVLLPDGYASSGRRYPVLYLLAGHTGAYYQWSTNGKAAPYTRGLPLIVVMPDGLGGWYSNPASGTGARWEDYVLGDLIPYVDGHYRTVAGRAGRALAGPSMGGLGAFDLAARHPDTFVGAASFSGSLDLLDMEGGGWRTGFPDLAVFGNPATYGWYWEGHDPVELAPNLRGVRLYLASGDGRPGPFEPHGHVPDPDPGEQYSLVALQQMAAALRRAGIMATVDDYGPGVHTWPYWQRDLRHALPVMLDAFAHPPAPPHPWGYRTTDGRFAVWGYRVASSGTAHGWTELRDVSPAGLTADGAGALSIVTAPLYRPGAPYAVAVDGVLRGQPVRADATGRLSLQLALHGPRARRHLTIARAGA